MNEAKASKDIPLIGEFPIVALGYGLIEVAEGNQEGVPALIFGRNGAGRIGEATQPERAHLPGETLAVVTFSNVESLEVALEKLRIIREKIAVAAAPDRKPVAWQLRKEGRELGVTSYDRQYVDEALQEGWQIVRELYDAPVDDAKDAARYRWLREDTYVSVHGVLKSALSIYAPMVTTHADIDAAIDAAMQSGR